MNELVMFDTDRFWTTSYADSTEVTFEVDYEVSRHWQNRKIANVVGTGKVRVVVVPVDSQRRKVAWCVEHGCSTMLDTPDPEWDECAAAADFGGGGCDFHQVLMVSLEEL